MHVFIKKNPHLLVFQLQRSITGYLFLFCLLLKLKVGRGEVSLSLKRNPNQIQSNFVPRDVSKTGERIEVLLLISL